MSTDTTTDSIRQDAGTSSGCSRRHRGSDLLVEWPTSLSATRKPQPMDQDQDQRENALLMKSFHDQHDDLTTSTARTSFASSLPEHGNSSTSSTDRATFHGTSTPAPASSKPSEQLSKPRAIHFSSKVNIKIIPSMQSYSLELIERTYYSKDDLAEQREEYVATAKEMRRRYLRGEDPLQVREVKLKARQGHRHQPFVVKSTTARGLEYVASPQTLEDHQQEKINSIDAVLLAQENDFTPEEIAVVYGHRSRSAKKRARSYGLADAES